MTRIREALIAAFKSLLRGRSSILAAILSLWRGGSGGSGQQHERHRNSGGPGSASAPTARTNGVAHNGDIRTRPLRSPADFLKEAEELLLSYIHVEALRTFATGLKGQFRERLQTNMVCMLPSYNHQLPSGNEQGRYLALDVGGSTLRVALVELNGRRKDGQEAGGEQVECSRIVLMNSFKIDQSIKNLEGRRFFDWMAARIRDTVESELGHAHSAEQPILMGLAWSFPIEQTSLKGGRLQGMGKGFLAANGLIGQDLGEIINAACRKQGLHAELSAIVNDSTAALLSQAYTNTSTRFGLILGTGVNIAVYLPVCALGRAKFGSRPEDWFCVARHVVINTELGMFGHGILPTTRWDLQLKAAHPKPDFQPLEHMVSGFYLGEVVRLALAEAVETAGVFGGRMPESLRAPYSLSTETISMIEGDSAPALEASRVAFTALHPPSAAPPSDVDTDAATTTTAGSDEPRKSLPYEYTAEDMTVVRTLASLVSQRSSAIVAASLVALWELRAETGDEYRLALSSSPPPTENGHANGNGNGTHAARTTTVPKEALADEVAALDAELALPRTMVAFNGSVIENYPRYRASLQRYMGELVAAGPRSAAAAAASSVAPAADNDDGAEATETEDAATPTPPAAAAGVIDLVAAKESSIIGAAVALACLAYE